MPRAKVIPKIVARSKVDKANMFASKVSLLTEDDKSFAPRSKNRGKSDNIKALAEALLQISSAEKITITEQEFRENLTNTQNIAKGSHYVKSVMRKLTGLGGSKVVFAHDKDKGLVHVWHREVLK